MFELGLTQFVVKINGVRSV